MANRTKYTFTFEKVSSTENPPNLTPKMGFPLDSMQEWIETCIKEQTEASSRWNQLTEIVRSERNRAELQLQHLKALRKLTSDYRLEKRILTEEQQRKMDDLRRQAEAVWNEAQGTSAPLAIEGPPLLFPSEPSTSTDNPSPRVPPLILPVPTLAAKKLYRPASLHSLSSSGEDQLKIDESEPPKKKTKKKSTADKTSKKERKTSGSSHHSTQ